ncbi:MAG: EamA family transporter [Kiritimatiellae bacterium]|nr:EamA family transporter [Kiritimatiellia bacterium]
MKAEFWAVLTALCWATGSLLEKKGVHLGRFTPVMGTTIRTAVSLVLLGLLAAPYWRQVKDAGAKPIVMIALGGGVLAGGLGVVFLYTGLKSGQISTVMTIAFCLAPVFGTVLGVLILREKISALQAAGIVLCVLGAAMTVYFKPTLAGGS